MKLGIFNKFNGMEENYIKACADLGIQYEVVNIITTEWLDNIKKSNCDGF